uniref:Uncharacterized protein n=1 Tax=Chromera velia CCMP2878 TaxID=1169474 RepID=A0A0G4F6W3_9ALVE|eukprot:Cvel_15520.t1-p1 / transcript=Cvel_15520.t1 / gene=Cvel_15520 / organism=Chromera_velia_CCMP2878 / gene_product=hypothetical protein / transcript_product=hypothetical protein / location=Cvel_scaffold1152:44376-45405(-) / protein_length=317 / sequence_SO=supercontig / SO=protein_coding / is_pseudo=false
MKQEYSSTLLAMQLAVQERVQVFPWLLDHHDRNGRVVIPSGVVLSFAKIDQRLENLLLDSDDAEWEIADPAKVIMIVNALTDDQRMKLVNSLRSKLPGLGGQLDLRQIDYATLKKELEWFTSFDRDVEIKARQRQSGGREKAFRGQQRRGRGSGGFRNQENRQNGQRSSQQSPPQQQQQPWGPKRCWWCQDTSHFEKNCSVSGPGSQLQAGHLELRSQQQGVGGGEEKEKQSGQGREPVQAAQPAEKEGEGEVVPPDIPDDDSLFGLNLLGESGGAAALASFLAREGEQQGSRKTEGVQEAQDDKKVQGAQKGKRVQ